MKIKPLYAAIPLILSSQLSYAQTGLFEYGFNVDGTVSSNSAPAQVNLAGFNTTTGLGTITANIFGAGSHSFAAFFDHEIDEASNTYFNEFGSANGSPAAGLTWEIDEPGWSFGDIYTNFLANALDNLNGVPSGTPDDVSMALGWNFSLNTGELAIISFVLGQSAPTNGFYLAQTDPDSNAAIYLSTNLTITGDNNPNPVPEPTTLWLMGVGLLGAAFQSKLRKQL